MSTQILSNKLTRLNTLFAMVITTLFAVQAHAMFGFEPYYKFGAVYTRSIVVDPSTNMPIWVEYDETGREAGVIGGMQDGDFTFSGTEYRAYHDQYTQIMEDMPDAIWMSVYDYITQQNFETYNGETFSPVAINPDYENVQFVLVRSKELTQIPDGEYHLLARFPIDVRRTTIGDYASLLIRSDPATGEVSNIVTPSNTDNNIGFRVKFFGPEGDDTGEEALDGVDTTTINYRKATDVIYGPIEGARITTTPAARITDGAETGEDGKYSMHYTLPPCPGFTFSYTTPAYLELQYNRFNPRLPGYRIYWQQRIDYDFCNGLAATAPPLIRPAVIGILASAATPVKRPRDFPIDIMVINGRARLENPDGSGVDITPELTDIQSVWALDNFSKSATPPSYDLTVPGFVRQVQSNYDFDRDGEFENTLLGRVVEVPVEDGEEGETEKKFFLQNDENYPCVVSRDENGILCTHQGVFLSSKEGVPGEDQPDLLRIADWRLSDGSEFDDKGLVTTLGEIDLSNTDLYVFRESNGELIAERRGLNTAEATSVIKNDLGAADGEFFYTLEMRGPREGIYSASYLRRNPVDPVTGNPVGPQNAYRFWQQQSGVVEKFWDREADHLRPGERIRIIAINRVTGYMGTITTELKAHSTEDEDGYLRNALVIDYNVDDIIMRPPNLKIWAERSYTVEQGLTRGTQYLPDDMRDDSDPSQKSARTVGFEGAALGTDTAIVVYTEWLDHDGRALPEALGDYGYTARFAKIVAPNILDDAAVGDSAVAQFPVKPGKHTNVIRFSNPNSNREHLYIHVSGQPFTRQSEFDQLEAFYVTGANSGMQEYRPDRYVPFKVPVYNEDDSLESQQVYREFVKAQGEDADITTPKPEPIYEWLYRPEFQFSIYDLTQQQIRRQITADDVEDIYTSENPVIASTDELVAFAYSLLSRDINSDGLDNDTLTAFSYDGERELIIALGEEEMLATIGSDQTITFENLGALAGLDPEDYLSMRLYSNNDAANVLWEWAFEYLDFYAVLDNDILPAEDGAVEISADTPEVDLVAHILGFANRDPESKYPVSIRWELEGEGELETSVEVDDEFAIFNNKLTLTNKAGDIAKVTAVLTNNSSGDTQRLPLIFRVVPGVPTSITVSPDDDNQLFVGGVGEVSLSGVAKDAWGNTVADGTAVGITTDGSLEVSSRPDVTTNGAFQFSLKGSDYAEACEFTVRIGATSLPVAIDVRPVNISITGLSPAMETDSKQQFQISVTADGAAQPNYPLDVWAEKGRLSASSIITGEDGTATLTLFTPTHETEVVVKAMAALQAPTEQLVQVQYPNDNTPRINNYRGKMVGDTTAPSVFTHTRWDGSIFNIEKAVAGEVEVMGAPNQQLSLELGNAFLPNRLTQAAYWMNNVDEGVLTDEVGLSSGVVENVTLVEDTLGGTGFSFQFSQQRNELDEIIVHSRAKVVSASRLQLADGLSFSLEVKANQPGGQLVNLGNGIILALQTDGSLSLTANMDDASSYTLNHPGFLLNQWQKIAVTLDAGSLRLQVGEDEYSTSVTGVVQYGDIALQDAVDAGGNPLSSNYGLVVGQAYDGKINTLRWFNLSSSPLITFADGSESRTVLLPESGTAQVVVEGKGELLSFGSELSKQNIAISIGQESQVLTLMSTAAFERIAAAMLDAGIVPGDPGFDEGYLNDTTAQSLDGYNSGQYYSRHVAILFPEAYAYDIGFMDILEIVASFLALDSLQVIWDQVGNMLSGRDVDIVAFSVALLDVLTLFPPAAPLKAVTTPAKLAIKLLKLGNNKAVKYLGGVFKKMFQKAKGRDFRLVYQGVAFMIIVADMATDEESREAIGQISNMINSTDDFLDILEFVSLADDETELPDTASIDAMNSTWLEEFLVSNNAVMQARAKLPLGIGKKWASALKKLKPMLDDLPGGTAAKTLGVFAKTVKNMPPGDRARFIRHAFNIGMIRAIFTVVKRGGKPETVKNFLLGFGGQRIPPITMLAIIGYIEQQILDGQLFPENGTYALGTDRNTALARLTTLILMAGYSSAVDSEDTKPRANQVQGAAFQLMHLALLHATGSTIIGIEVPRIVYIFKRKEDLEDDPLNITRALKYGRRVDIVTEGTDSAEEWHEVKSWQSRKNGDSPTNKPYSIKEWRWATNPRKDGNKGENSTEKRGKTAHHQFVLDRIAKGVGVTEDAPQGGLQTTNIEVSEYLWQFHKFKTYSRAKGKKGTKTLIARSADLDLIEEQLVKDPEGIPSRVPTIFKSHLADGDSFPGSHIKEGALSVLLQSLKNSLQDELEEAIQEELDDYEIPGGVVSF